MWNLGQICSGPQNLTMISTKDSTHSMCKSHMDRCRSSCYQHSCIWPIQKKRSKEAQFSGTMLNA